mmetsp:Transcript_60809/g.162766  ORF Transcript_60809/g.162766 Transcript_60809/m.162766 type:complete len:210 (+) Transcript_60809:122-751(+)
MNDHQARMAVERIAQDHQCDAQDVFHVGVHASAPPLRGHVRTRSERYHVLLRLPGLSVQPHLLLLGGNEPQGGGHGGVGRGALLHAACWCLRWQRCRSLRRRRCGVWQFSGEGTRGGGGLLAGLALGGRVIRRCPLCNLPPLHLLRDAEHGLLDARHLRLEGGAERVVLRMLSTTRLAREVQGPLSEGPLGGLGRLSELLDALVQVAHC